MKTEKEIKQARRNVYENATSKFTGQTYEQGVAEALDWVMGDVSDEEFEYPNE